jgi:hypothetical protein
MKKRWKWRRCHVGSSCDGGVVGSSLAASDGPGAPWRCDAMNETRSVVVQNVNSTCSANLPAWVPPAFLVNSSLHGWASPVDRGDNTTRFATPTLTRFNISSRLFPIMAPLTLGCHLHKTVNNGRHSGLNG